MHRSRTPLIAGNWKMNTTLADALLLARTVTRDAEHLEHVEVLMCPPTIWAATVAHDVLPRGSRPNVKLGVQNVYSEAAGAFTGETSPAAAAEVAEYALIGHSERTHLFKEDAGMVAAKLAACFENGLKPVLCIGEDEEGEGSAKKLAHALGHLIKGLAADLHDRLTVAYEPVWAIGTGKAAMPEYAEGVLGALRHVAGENARLLYGGSANKENARGFLELPECDGLLIGGVSLKAKPFLSICRMADELAR